MNVTQQAYETIVEDELKRRERQGYRYERNRIGGTLDYLIYNNTTKIGEILIGAEKGIAYYSFADEVGLIFLPISQRIDLLRIAHAGNPPITDPTDKAIYEIVSNDPDLADDQVGFILADKYNIRNKDGTPLARQSINPRRRTLEKMGYTVR